MRRRIVSYDRVHSVAKRGLLEGWLRMVEADPRDKARFGELRPRYGIANLEMDCESPFTYELFGVTRKIEDRKSILLLIHAQCRKCAMCVVRRSRMWAGKALAEYNRWPRTYFGTFTASPGVHERLDLEIEVHGIGRPGTSGYRPPQHNINLLSSEMRFEYRVRKFGEYITKWFKVLRKGDADHPAPRFRYLLIAEAHDSENTSSVMAGRPHYHILLHEQETFTLVLGQELEEHNIKTRQGWRPALFVRDEAFVRRSWDLGFTKFQVADSPGSVTYLCKYLAKSMRVRVRPSQGYGGKGGSQVPSVEGEVPPVPERSEAGPQAPKTIPTNADASVSERSERQAPARKGMGPVSSALLGARNGGTPAPGEPEVRPSCVVED